ncbi:DNA-binding transcriptional LysR family regulator [Bradyrhizobium yuanmingense]
MARINSRQVEAFRATMLTGSVTEAAALMKVTQPAVSRLLRDLQALLKMELFERRGTGLVPTAAAMALYTEVERSLRRPRTHHCGGGRNPRPSHGLAADRSAAGAVERLSAAAHRSLPEGAAKPQPGLLRCHLADRGRLGAEQSM